MSRHMASDIYIRQVSLFSLQSAVSRAYLHPVFAARGVMCGVLKSFRGRSAMNGLVGWIVERDHVV
jgi:hypothetical protein